MICFFGDDASLKSDPSHKHDDVFLFGGYYLEGASVKSLENEIEEVKAQEGCPPDMPIKWNFMDLERLYKGSGKLDLHKHLLSKMETLRHGMLQLLGKHNAKVLVAAIRGYSPTKLQERRKYYGWALTDILQRLAMDAGREAPTDRVNVGIHFDWPSDEVKKAHFDVFHLAYYQGRSPTGIAYKAGTLKSKGFLCDMSFGSTEHNSLLQLADMTLGVCRDFVHWCCTGRNLQRVKGYFPIVSARLRRAIGYDVFQTGLVVSPGEFLTLVESRQVELSRVFGSSSGIRSRVF